jgi:hypothetical protein
LEPWKFSQGRKKAQGGSGESTTAVGLADREIWTVEEIYVQEEPQQVETATRIWGNSISFGSGHVSRDYPHRELGEGLRREVGVARGSHSTSRVASSREEEPSI